MATSREQVLELLQRLEVPACGCSPFRPCDCATCRQTRASQVLSGKLKEGQRPKGIHPDLLWACKHIRAMKPHAIDLATWGLLLARYSDEYDAPPPASSPTAARPGSAGKIEVMRARLERGEHLHHAHDVQSHDLLGVGTPIEHAANGQNARSGMPDVVQLVPGAGVRLQETKS